VFVRFSHGLQHLRHDLKNDEGILRFPDGLEKLTTIYFCDLFDGLGVVRLYESHSLGDGYEMFTPFLSLNDEIVFPLPVSNHVEGADECAGVLRKRLCIGIGGSA
jgi:hypothetical protein